MSSSDKKVNRTHRRIDPTSRFPQGDELFRLITEHATDLIAVLDVKGVRLYNSPSYQATLDDPKKLIGTDSFSEIHPEDREEVRRIFKETVRTGIGQRTEYRFVRKDGSLRYIESQGSAVTDEAGKTIGVVVVGRDVTERRESESKLHLLANALNGTKDCFCLTDLNNTILFVNPAFCETYGYEMDELVGKSIEVVRSPESDPAIVDRILSSTLKGNWHGELINRRKDGTDFPVELWTSVVKNDASEAVGFVGVARDITQRKRAEKIQAATYKISEAVMDAEDLPELYKLIHSIVGELLPATNFYIALYDPESGMLSFPYFVDEYDETPAPKKLGRGLTEYVLRTGEPLLASPAVFNELVAAGEAEAIGAPSIDWLGVPLKTKDRTIGVLVVQTYTEGVRYHEADREILMFVSSQVAMAIERKRAEKALQEAEFKFRSIVEQSLVGVYVIQDGRFPYVNPKLAEIFGYRQEEIISSKTVDDLTAEADRELVRENIRRRTKGEIQSIHYGFRGQKKDGSLIDIEVFGTRTTLNGKPAVIGTLLDVTERKRAQEAIEESEQRFRQLVEFLPDTVAVHSEGKFVFVNPAGVKLLGASSPDEIIGLPILDVVHPDYRHTVTRRVESLAKGAGEAPLIEEKLIRLDGGIIDVEVVAMPFTYKNKPAVQVVVRDITERKRAEEALRESEEQFRNLADKSPNMIFINQGGKVVYVNERCVELMGYTREEFLASTFDFRCLVAPEFVDMIKLYYQRHVRGEEVPPYEYAVVTKHGRRIDAINATRLVTYKGERAIMGIITDITEQKRAQEELLKLRKAVETASEAIFMTDRDGTFTYVNPGFQDLYGFSAYELVGKATPRILKSGRLDAQTYRQFWETILQKKTLRGEMANKTKDGRIIEVESSVSSVLDEHGEIVGFLCIQSDITDRKRAEEALRESEEKYRDVVERASDGIVIIQDGKVRFLNTRLGEMWGGTTDEIVGTSFANYVHPDELAHVVDRYRRRMADETVSPIYETALLRKDGTKAYVELNAGVISFAGRPADLVIVRDITDRKQTERKLHSLNRALRTISECNEALVHATGEKKLLDEICRIIVQTGGYRLAWVGFAEDDETKTVRPVAQAGFDEGYLDAIKISWSDTDHDQGPVGTAIRTGQPSTIQNINSDERFKPWQGQAIRRGFASVIALPLISNGRAFGALAIYSADVDAFTSDEIQLLMELADNMAFGIVTVRTRKEHEQATEKIQEQAALLDIATDAIIVRELEGHVLFWNKGAERLYQWAANEALGKDIRDLIYRNESEQLDSVTKVVKEAGEWTGELRQVTKDGTPIIVESRWTLMRDGQGQPKSLLVVNSDITSKKRLEAQFLRAQRMEGIGTLAGGIAHDLNNVLAPILMSIEILRKKFLDPQSHQILNALESSAQRGAGMVQQVLTFARGVEGERVAIQVRHLIKEIEKIIRETFPKMIQLRMDLPKDLWVLMGDATQLHQVMLNLCVNARDAMPDGGVLTLSAENVTLDNNYAQMHAEANPGPYVVLKVADTGVGISPNVIDKIFEPFFTTKEVGKGTGLGLSTVHSIVKSHGGFINVYSEVGRGTTFKVFLPAQQSAEEQKKEEDHTELPDGHGEVILVIDDEPAIRDITKDTLEHHGYKVIIATDGADGLAKYMEHKNSVALVLTDMLMPFLDGAATVRALHKIDPRLKVIVASGLSTNEKMAEATSTGIVAFLTKPYTAEKLLTTIRGALEGK